MWTPIVLVSLIALTSNLVQGQPADVPLDPIASRILREALADGIDLAPFNFTAPALQEIVAWAHFDAEKSDIPADLLRPARNATTVDVHAHHVPNWFRTIEPSDGGMPSPVWTLESQLQHMANQSIGRSILSIPKPNIFLGDKNATVAIARLLNENTAALVKVLPNRFSFFATSALPYVNESLAEVKRAVETLGAVGVALTSNHEGEYLGNPQFARFFAGMEEMKAIVFVHPANPLMETAGRPCVGKSNRVPSGESQFIILQPWHRFNACRHTKGIAEFFFETARTFMDLALSRTLQNLTHLNWIIPHVGGSLPSIIDRSIREDTAAIMEAFHTRCWWDSAGITYAHQLGGLLAYNISPSFLLYGSDWPWIPAPLVDPAFDTIATSPFLDDAQKQAMRSENVKRLFEGKIEF
ncbi:Amidohydro-rel domain-containing protein [Mycena venus]|uniref:Amidohydro-rel domain-containing protein n=1 Tax=Mycena venus TaxID=2733690 RepID=A0A8H7D005_9AGAR|nr:Amidohydro-rel domain-containing protein [Mycena venus]